MFSTTHAAADSVKVYLVKTPTGYFNTSLLSGREHEMLMNNIAYYHHRASDGFQDPIVATIHARFKHRVGERTYRFLEGNLSNSQHKFNDYPAWWRRYFMQVQPRTFTGIAVVATYIYFHPAIHKSAVDEIVFNVDEHQ
jgi:hypothetical protein